MHHNSNQVLVAAIMDPKTKNFRMPQKEVKVPLSKKDVPGASSEQGNIMEDVESKMTMDDVVWRARFNWTRDTLEKSSATPSTVGSTISGDQDISLEGIVRKVLKDFVENDLKEIVKREVKAAIMALQEEGKFRGEPLRGEDNRKNQMLSEKKTNSSRTVSVGCGSRKSTKVKASTSQKLQRHLNGNPIDVSDRKKQAYIPKAGDMSNFCSFHRVRGHSIDMCESFKIEMESFFDSDKEVNGSEIREATSLEVPKSQGSNRISGKEPKLKSLVTISPEPDMSSFCNHHRVHGHSTEDCRGLKCKIDELWDSVRDDVVCTKKAKKSQVVVERKSEIDRQGKILTVQQPRRFSKFKVPMSKMFVQLQKAGLLDCSETKSPSPSGANQSQFCLFHKQKGHNTNYCRDLRHKIQDLIDSGEIAVPEKLS